MRGSGFFLELIFTRFLHAGFYFITNNTPAISPRELKLIIGGSFNALVVVKCSGGLHIHSSRYFPLTSGAFLRRCSASYSACSFVYRSALR